MRKKPLLIVCLVVLINSLSACGYRGALYLPDESEQNQNTTEQPATTPGDSQ
ncbi:lipoprotein [Aestuariibacter sp. A3R04]|uniref:LPS translocon maturation chaperone LptM n=1 Tax=Aestuariibacter sp. A3R04 TaxID=2841571 RepID=UPI00352F7573